MSWSDTLLRSPPNYLQTIVVKEYINYCHWFWKTFPLELTKPYLLHSPFSRTQRSSKQIHYYQHYTTDGTSIACTWTSKCRYPSLALLCWYWHERKSSEIGLISIDKKKKIKSYFLLILLSRLWRHIVGTVRMLQVRVEHWTSIFAIAEPSARHSFTSNTDATNDQAWVFVSIKPF